MHVASPLPGQKSVDETLGVRWVSLLDGTWAHFICLDCRGRNLEHSSPGAESIHRKDCDHEQLWCHLGPYVSRGLLGVFTHNTIPQHLSKLRSLVKT